jgi:hypothetical protein
MEEKKRITLNHFCTKDFCEDMDADGYCTLPECKYYICPETIGDDKYHRAKDEGRL